MPSVDHSHVKNQLEKKLAELESRAKGIENRLSDPGSPDWEENAVLHANDEVLNVLNDLTEHDIVEIKMALSRIESGSYGICADCGKPIAKVRLSALPFTSTCIDCAR